MLTPKGITVTFLGTGTSQGVPVIACQCRVCTSSDMRDKRLRTSVMIESETTTVVIDTGPDFRQQMLREGVQKLDAVILTHEHKDHLGGVDDVRAFNFKQQKDMDIYCTARVEEALRREISYAFSEVRYPGVPEISIKRIDKNHSFTIGDLTFTPIEVMHHKLPVLGFRIDRFTYITDANYIEPHELEKIKGSEFLVLNALKYEDHISHFNVAQALDVIAQTSVSKGILTHMSHQLGLHAEEEIKLPEHVIFAFDGLKVHF